MLTQYPPILPHSPAHPTFSTPDITRIPASGREGWDLPVRRRRREGAEEGGRVREGGRDGTEEGGRVREGEREKVDQNTNCFVHLHTTQNLIPRQRNGMKVHTRLYATHHCPLWCVCRQLSCCS